MSLSMINQKLVLTRQKKVLYHCTEEPRISGVAIIDCVFCNVIGGWKILRRKQLMLMTWDYIFEIVLKFERLTNWYTAQQLMRPGIG